MRRFILALGVVMLALIVACGGGDGDDSNGDDNNGGDNDNGSASSGGNGNSGGSSSSSGSGGSGGNSGGGSDSNFCSAEAFDDFEDLDFTSFDDLEDQFEALDDSLQDWADNAPGDIEDDVDFVVGALRDLIQVLRDNDYNFLALASSGGDNPFSALDSAEFTAAMHRIGDYCGIDLDSPGGSIPGGSGGGSTGGGSSSGGSTGGGGGFLAGSLPDDYPDGLQPPDSEVGAVVDVGFGLTVEFTSTATIEEIKNYYEDLLGNATFADAESVLWIGMLDGKSANVSVTGTDGNLTVVIILSDTQ